MKRFCGISAALIAAAVLSACGGGGDDTGSNKTYAANSAWANLFGSAHSWTLSGSVSGSGQNLPVQSTLDLSLLADGTFAGSGESAKIRRLTTTANVNGQGSSSDYTSYYLNASNAFVGSVSADGTCALPSNVGLPPTTAAMGNSGTLANWTEYSSCSVGATKTGTGTASWSIEQADGKAYFCSTDTYASVDGTASSTEKDCFQVSETGVIGSSAKVSAVFTQNGISSTLSLSTP